MDMKIGKLEFKDYAAKKPVTVSSTGQLLTAHDVVGVQSLSLGSLHTLNPEAKLKLALARYELEPEFKLGILGVGILTKSEIVDHMQRATEFGQLALNVEMSYCNELIAKLGEGDGPGWPKVPKNPLPSRPDWLPVKKCISLKLMTVALFCENTTDPVTSSFAAYRIANVHPAFAGRGFNVNALTGTDDIRTNFVPRAKGLLTGYISGIGHGNYTTYTGNAFNHILEVGLYDPAEVKSKAIHFLSCETAGQLGPDAVKNAAKCYAGYSENFNFVWDDPNTTVDEALLFKQADSTFDIMMAHGATAQQAYDATIQAFNAAMVQVPNTAAATWLAYDRDHLKLLGNPGTTIMPYRYLRFCFPLSTVKQQALALAGELTEE
jgi:hypothetical protein